MGCHALLQRVFLNQGWNPRLLHWQGGSLPQSCHGSPELDCFSLTPHTTRSRPCSALTWVYDPSTNTPPGSRPFLALTWVMTLAPTHHPAQAILSSDLGYDPSTNTPAGSRPFSALTWVMTLAPTHHPVQAILISDLGYDPSPNTPPSPGHSQL